MKIFVGCSSSDEIDKGYFIECRKLLEELFKGEHSLVYGASSKGLMGEAYRIAKKNNRYVYGINPEIFKDDFDFLECNESIITECISRRTDKLIELSDVLLFLPGGIGTVYEFFSVIESKRSMEFDKPVVVFNANHYFDELFVFLDKLYNGKFTSSKVKDCYFVTSDVDECLEYINNFLRNKSR